MLVTINNITSGNCIWCCQKFDDAVDATFSDGLKGILCRKHFWDALKARAEKPQPQKSPAKTVSQPKLSITDE